jgi:hypothetical protein
MAATKLEVADRFGLAYHQRVGAVRPGGV